MAHAHHTAAGWHPVSVALGSNLGDPAATLCRTRQALTAVLAPMGCDCLRWSRLWLTQPVGPPQPPYLNAVLVFCACPGLQPLALLDVLQELELREGRVRGERWGPRTLDLDIITFGACIQHTPRLTLPHPRAHERGFVLWPLLDAWPDADITGHGRARDLAGRLGLDGLEPQSSPPGWE